MLKRPSPTTVIACLALFFAIAGGSAIALQGRNTVDSGDIKRGAVKTSDIANNAVTTKKIRNNHVRAADIQNNAVGTGEIGNGQVREADLAPVDPYHVVGRAGQPAFNTGGEGDCLWGSTPTIAPPIELTPAAFFKDRDGVVHLAGNAVSNNGAGGDAMCGGAGGEAIEDGYAFVLPPGYRPQFDTFLFGGGGGTSGVTILVVGNRDLVAPAGTLPAGAVTDIQSSGGFFLEGLSFRTAGPGTGLPRREVVDAVATGEIPTGEFQLGE